MYRHLTRYLLTLILISFTYSFRTSSSNEGDKDICKFVKQKSAKLKKLNFDESRLDSTYFKKYNKLDNKLFNFFFGNGFDGFEGHSYILGYYELPNQRTCVVLFNNWEGCYISLHVIDNCSKLVSIQYLASSDPTPMYLRQSTLSKDKTTISTTLSVSGDLVYLKSDTIQIDTILTDVYKIDLRSKNIDTTYVLRQITKKQLHQL